MTENDETRRDIKATFIVVSIVVLLAVAAINVIVPRLQPSTTLQIGDGVFRATLAMDYESRERGLAGVEELPDDEAMIFVFDHASRWGIWMKDMVIPIDIVWLDDDKKVVDIVRNVQPESIQQHTTYRPESDAKYAIEFAAGTVEAKSIKIGRMATFEYVKDGRSI